MKRVIKVLLFIITMMSFLTVCSAVSLDEAKREALEKIENTFTSDYKGWEKDPEYKENPKYISTSDTTGIYSLYVRKLKDNGNSIATETFLEEHIAGEKIEKAEGSGNVIHPGKDDPDWPNGCPNCSLKAGNPVYHEDARIPTCQCSKTESETEKIEEFRNRAGWKVVKEEQNTEYVDYTCNNKEVYGDDAYESKVTCTVKTITITIEKEEYDKDTIEECVAASEEQKEPEPIIPTDPESNTINRIIVRASKNPVIFQLNPASEPGLDGILAGDTAVVTATVSPGTSKTVTCNITLNGWSEGNLVPIETIQVVYQLYVIDFRINQSSDITDQTTKSPNNISLKFLNNLTPPFGYTFESEDPNGRAIDGKIYVGKNDFWLEVVTGDDGYSKVEHYVILDTKRDDGTKNVDFQILYTDNSDEKVTDKKFIAKKPIVNLKLEPVSDSIIDMNLNNIIWCKQGIQIGEGKTFNTNILPTELNKQTEFEMIITPKDGQPQLTAIEHYAEPYSPVPWDTGTGTLPKDDSLRILSVRDLRWKTITDKFYVNDSQGGDILKPQKVNKGNPIMGYGVEFNLNTDNLTVGGIPTVNISVGGLTGLYDITSGTILDLEDYKAITIKQGDNKQQGFLKSYEDGLYSWMYYLPPIVGYSSGIRPNTVGITFDITLKYSDGRTVNYKEWTDGWTGKAFTYNGQRSLLQDIKEGQIY